VHLLGQQSREQGRPRLQDHRRGDKRLLVPSLPYFYLFARLERGFGADPGA
jgi:hypothetical protein